MITDNKIMTDIMPKEKKSNKQHTIIQADFSNKTKINSKKLVAIAIKYVNK